MSRFVRADGPPLPSLALALGLGLIVGGSLVGCGGGDVTTPGDRPAIPPAEPGQVAIPDPAPGPGATGAEPGGTSGEVPVVAEPEPPGLGS